jgi:hypothetical protein
MWLASTGPSFWWDGKQDLCHSIALLSPSEARLGRSRDEESICAFLQQPKKCHFFESRFGCEEDERNVAGTDVNIFVNLCRNLWMKILAFFPQTAASFCKKMIIKLFFFFIAKNCDHYIDHRVARFFASVGDFQFLSSGRNSQLKLWQKKIRANRAEQIWLHNVKLTN